VGNGGGQQELADRLFWQLAGSADLAAVLEKWIQAGASEVEFWSVSKPEECGQAYSKTTLAEDELWSRHIPNPRSLVRLAANPFLLTMLFKVWRSSKGELPANRGELFGRFIDSLLWREGLLEDPNARRRTADGGRLLAGLTELAWRLQRVRIDEGKGESGDFGVLTVTSRAAALDALGDEHLLKKAVDGTLLEGDDEIRFRHQLLQEYFTAQALQGRMPTLAAGQLWPPDRWWERSGWEEAAVLLAGFHPAGNAEVIRWLAKAQPEVAAQCLLQSGVEPADKENLLGEWQKAWLPLLTDVKREPRPEARAAIGRALGRLGLDNRKGVGVRDGIPEIDWVPEIDSVKAERFYISRYLVTNAQYDAFLQAEDGYEDDRWWKGLTDPNRERRQPSWSEGNHPRETVSWHEAMAFCAWLSHKLGYEVRLPAEHEWERAARGAEGREYPWGEGYKTGYANIYEIWEQKGRHYLRRTSPVGMYPQGASPEGVLDLAGNVWEWCLNEYEKPERTQRSGTGSRVLRGGSWYYNHVSARAAFRIHPHPDLRVYLIGFRLVCSAPIPAGR